MMVLINRDSELVDSKETIEFRVSSTLHVGTKSWNVPMRIGTCRHFLKFQAFFYILENSYLLVKIDLIYMYFKVDLEIKGRYMFTCEPSLKPTSFLPHFVRHRLNLSFCPSTRLFYLYFKLVLKSERDNVAALSKKVY